MTKKELLAEIAEILDVDDEITETTELRKYREFDSLALMSLSALLGNKFGMKVSGAQLKHIQTPADLFSLIGEDQFSE